MKISCTKENVARALALVSGVTGKNLNLPILNNVLIKADQKVEIIATNLELAVVVNVRAKIEEPGSFTVPARTLLDFVNLLPNEKIDFTLKDNELLVTCGKSSTKIKGTSAEDYPIIPALDQGNGFVVEAAELRQGLSQVLPAVARNDIRPELAGIYCGLNLEGDQKMTLAATDSYRLAEKKVSLKQGEATMQVIIPGRTAQEFSHLLSGVEAEEKQARLLVSENQIMISYGSAQIVSRLVEGSYPDYKQIIPKEFASTATVDTTALIKEMKASGLFTTSGVNAVSLIIRPEAGAIGISSVSTQTGEYASELSAEITGAGATLLLNNRYILDGINSFNAAETQIKIINADSPCIFTPAGDASYLYIVMPIRQ